MRILILGGAGYIGSMLSTELVGIGHDVTVVDKLKYNSNSLSHLYFYKNFKLVKDDIRKKSIIKLHLKNKDLIIPLAALVGAPLCEKNKKDAISTNLGAIKTLLSLVKKSQKIIFLTTNSGYGIGKKGKYCDETSLLNPISLYGKTKMQAEELIKKHANFVSLRLATVFGISYRMRSDLLVNNFVETAIKHGQLKLYESHFRRNFIHIRDVVNAITFISNNFSKFKNNIFNLGLSSANITKLGLAKKIKKQIKVLKIKEIKNKKDPDQRDYFVSNKKIEKKGFKAKISLDQGINELKVYFLNSKESIKNNY